MLLTNWFFICLWAILTASRTGYYRPNFGSAKLRYHFGLYYARADRGGQRLRLVELRKNPTHLGERRAPLAQGQGSSVKTKSSTGESSTEL